MECAHIWINGSILNSLLAGNEKAKIPWTTTAAEPELVAQNMPEAVLESDHAVCPCSIIEIRKRPSLFSDYSE